MYKELLRGLGSQPAEGSHPPPSSMRMASYIGKNMCQLPLFRAIRSDNSKLPLHFLVEAITPSQWKPAVYPAPLSERFGNGHLEMRTLHVERAAKTPAHRSRVKILTSTDPVDKFSLSGTLGLTANDDMHVASAELLGLDSDVLATSFRKKTGGVYGHFFKDLSPGTPSKILIVSVPVGECT